MVSAASAESRLRETLVRCVSRIYARGWCDGTGGNYSVLLGRDPLRLLVTRTGIDKGRIVAGDLMVMDRECRPVEGGTERPSAEARLHVSLVERAGAGAVLHTHSVWGTLLGEHFAAARGFTLSGYEMLKGLAGVVDPDAGYRVPVVPNSQDMAWLAGQVEQVLDARPDARGFLIAGHGLYTWGTGLDEAYRHVEIHEFLFRLVGQRMAWKRFDGAGTEA